MISIKYNRDINKIEIVTDDPSVHYFLESKQSSYQYLPWKKQYGYTNKTIKLYDPGKHTYNGYFKFTLGIGWAGYLLGVFKEKISKDEYNNIIHSCVLADNYRTTPFSELRDYQNDDILFMLKYRVGLMCVNTGYGKTQVIATLVNYAHESLGKKVLLVCPSNKARDELVKRCYNLFGLTVSDREKNVNGHLDAIITSGLKNSLRMKDPLVCSNFKKTLAGYDWVLVDEVEYTLNDAGMFIYDNCIGAEKFYAFSGTADKEGGEAINFSNGLSETVLRNKDLVKYFGPSLVYRMPLNIKLTTIRILTESLDNLKLDHEKIDKSGNIYTEILNQIWMDHNVCNTVCRIIKKFPLCFIPINNLAYILNNWINNYFIGKFRILLICGEGYIYYDLEGNRTRLSLQESCDYIKNGLVDVIPSTSSGYRALDFPGLKNIFLITGKIAGVTLQSIGRVARGSHMNIITIEPYGKRKIPVYTKGAEERDEMIRGYYQYCDITDRVIDEVDL